LVNTWAPSTPLFHDDGEWRVTFLPGLAIVSLVWSCFLADSGVKQLNG
jgi:hypothetical protein